MAKKNMRNEFEFMSAVLDALGVDYEEADIKVRERWRGKVLDGWGVNYIPDDVKQFERWRGKCIEGLSKGGGGETWRTVYNGTVSMAKGAVGDLYWGYIENLYIDSDKIKVTYDGVEYILDKKTKTDGKPVYGGYSGDDYDFSEIPFAISSNTMEGGNTVTIVTNNNSPNHTIKIETLESGGSNRFTTAKVTISFDGGNYPSASVGFIDPQNTLGLVIMETSQGWTYDVPLYDGKAFIGLSGANNGVVISGDATYVTGTDYGKGFIVTGDCSLGVSRGAM